MSSKDAAALDVPDEEKTEYVRLDDAKGNMSPPAQGVRWFQRKGVALPNADDRLGLELDDELREQQADAIAVDAAVVKEKYERMIHDINAVQRRAAE